MLTKYFSLVFTGLALAIYLNLVFAGEGARIKYVDVSGIPVNTEKAFYRGMTMSRLQLSQYAAPTNYFRSIGDIMCGESGAPIELPQYSHIRRKLVSAFSISGRMSNAKSRCNLSVFS